ncbi:MAG: hypothetical protein PHY29_09105 [Syntrophales bacterium]|nr:hypothetical protein [Syntrophales bacterium]
MKKSFVLVFLSVICLISLSLSSFADGNKTVTIVYTGDLLGNITSIRCCGGRLSGGLARSASVIKSIRSNEDRLLLLDNGGLFPPIESFGRSSPEIVADLGLKAMNRMGYAAMNLGGNEFSLGADFLKKVTADIDFPVVTSNLVYKDSRLPFGEKYVIKNVGDVRVAIIGIMPSDSFKNVLEPQSVENMEIIPPKDALKDLLPEVAKKADLVILLSQCGFEITTLLVNSIDGIDLAISSLGKKSGFTGENTGTPVLEVDYRGKYLGVLKLNVDNSGHVVLAENEMIKLDESVEPDEEIVKITGDDIRKKIGEERKIRREQQRQEIEREIKELQKLSPQEYLEMQFKKSSEVGGRK